MNESDSIALPQAEADSPRRAFALAAGIVALGLAVRAFLVATGRTTLDGDEGIMGVMSYHLSTLQYFPLYFYRQHYMGTLEIPPLALLMTLGPDAWKFSIWPLRIVEAVYFIGLCWVHFGLVARLFGGRAAQWSLFFLCIAPIYWMDYSIRLRHATLMMLLGESMALVSLGLIEDWRDRHRARPGKVFLLGLIIGAAWWHYQLVSVYIGAAAVLFALSPCYVLDWIRRANMRARRPKEGPRPFIFTPGATIRLTIIVAITIVLAALTTGAVANPSFGYPSLIGGLLALLAFTEAAASRAYRREKAEMTLVVDPAVPRAEPLHRLGPALLGLGFVAGYLPALIYLARLNEEFWVAGVEFRPHDLLARARDLFVLDFSSMLEITESTSAAMIQQMTNRSFVNLAVYALALYVLLRKVAAPASRNERTGGIYFLSLLAILALLNVATPRVALFINPRFLFPAFSVISVGLGLAAEQIQSAARSLPPKIARPVFYLLGASLLAGAFLLWSPRWLSAERHEINWPSGHRQITIDTIHELERRGIERVRLPTDTDGILFGYELQFASGLSIRFNRGTVGDRLEGHVDESRYKGAEYRMLYPRDAGPAAEQSTKNSANPADTKDEPFRLGAYLVERAP